MHLRIAAVLLLAAILPNVHGAGAKDAKASVSFHLQAEVIDNPKMIFPLMVEDRKLFFRRMPEFQTKDFASYKALPNRDNPQVYDLVLKLKPHTAKRLALISNANRGKWIAAQLNGRSSGAVMINEQVDDGILVIWSTATLADLATLEKALPGTVEVE